MFTKKATQINGWLSFCPNGIRERACIDSNIAKIIHLPNL